MGAGFWLVTPAEPRCCHTAQLLRFRLLPLQYTIPMTKFTTASGEYLGQAALRPRVVGSITSKNRAH